MRKSQCCLPFHAAEQRSKKLKSDSAERSDFPMSPVLCEQHRVAEGQVNRLPFLLVRFLWAIKENERIESFS